MWHRNIADGERERLGRRIGRRWHGHTLLSPASDSSHGGRKLRALSGPGAAAAAPRRPLPPVAKGGAEPLAPRRTRVSDLGSRPLIVPRSSALVEPLRGV
jgi:hypothetical protein